LAKLTQRQPGVFIPHTEIVTAVLRDMGYDPDNLAAHGDPALGWRRGGPQSPPSIDRQITICFYGLVRKGKYPLCAYGPKRGLWGLTADGVQATPVERKIAAPKPSQKAKNATARFLDKRLKAKGGMTKSPLYQTMRAAVTRKLPVSAASDQIDDHIQQFLQRLISRDALAEWIDSGQEIPDTRIAGFAIRSAYTDCRDSSRNPVCRTLYGAKNEKELATPVTDVPLTVMSPQIAAVQDEDENLLYEVIDTMSPSVEETLAFQSIWQEIEDTLKARRPQTWGRYVEVVRLKAEGHSMDEIREKLSVSTNRAAALLSEARSVLRKAGEAQGFKSFDFPG
jgi:hypothetical protein